MEDEEAGSRGGGSGGTADNFSGNGGGKKRKIEATDIDPSESSLPSKSSDAVNKGRAGHTLSPEEKIQLLQEQLNQKDQQLKKTEEEKNQLQEEKKELQEKEKELQKEKRQLQEENKQSKQRERGKSIYRLIDLFDEGDKSLAEQRKKFYLEHAKDATPSSHTNTNHDGATYTKKDFVLMPVPEKSHEADEDMTSTILSMKGWPRQFAKEADVQVFVANMLEDVVAYFNILLRPKAGGVQLTVRKEASLFTNEPDHLVVLDGSSALCPLLVVEVKKPNEKVFDSKTVAGQLYDSIMAAWAFHGKRTFGLLTTFNRSKVVWPWSAQCDEEASCGDRLAQESLDKLSESLKKHAQSSNTVKQIKGNPDCPATPNIDEQEKGEPKTNSPPDLVNYAGDEVSSVVSGMGGLLPPPRPPTNPTNYDRELRCSEATYNPSQLFTALFNALAASLKMEEKPLQIIADWDEKGVLQQGRLCLVLRRTEDSIIPPDGKKKGHEWKTLESSIPMAGQWRINDKNIFFHLVDFLGEGATSRVWRAAVLDEKQYKGYGCAIKFWIKTWDPAENKVLTTELIRNESSASTKAELENYKCIYKDLFFSENNILVGRARLNYRWCMILPFFKPIQKSQQNADALENIKTVLENQFYNSTSRVSYQFKETDRRWRHVGIWKNNTVLFDLADLDKKEGVSERQHQKYVEKHVKTLRNRMGLEPNEV